MIWWRGNGLWMGTLVALIVISASGGGPKRLALGFAAAAVLVYLLHDSGDDESSLYSFRVRYWPPLLLVLAALAFLGL